MDKTLCSTPSTAQTGSHGDLGGRGKGAEIQGHATVYIDFEASPTYTRPYKRTTQGDVAID